MNIEAMPPEEMSGAESASGRMPHEPEYRLPDAFARSAARFGVDRERGFENEEEEPKKFERSFERLTGAPKAQKNFKKEIAKQVIRTGIGTVASIAGVKSFYDVPKYLWQRYRVRGMRGKGGLKDSVEDVLQSSQERRMRSAQAGNDDAWRQGLVERGTISLAEYDEMKRGVDERDAELLGGEGGKVKDAIKDLNKRLALTREGTQKNSEQRRMIAKILAENRTAMRQTAKEREKEMQLVLDEYTTTKITGMQAARETLNTALVGTGAYMLRGVGYSIMDGAERYQRLKKEARREKLEELKGWGGNGSDLIDTVETRKIGIWKDVIKGGIRETLLDAALVDTTAAGKTRLQKGVDFVKAWGKIARYAGIGRTVTFNSSGLTGALEALASKPTWGSVGHNFEGNILRTISLFQHGNQGAPKIHGASGHHAASGHPANTHANANGAGAGSHSPEAQPSGGVRPPAPGEPLPIEKPHAGAPVSAPEQNPAQAAAAPAAEHPAPEHPAPAAAPEHATVPEHAAAPDHSAPDHAKEASAPAAHETPAPENPNSVTVHDKPMEIDVEGAKHVWGASEKALAQAYGDKFAHLNDAEKNYNIDAMRRIIARDPEAYGFSKGADINVVTTDDLKHINFAKALEEMEKHGGLREHIPQIHGSPENIPHDAAAAHAAAPDHAVPDHAAVDHAAAASASGAPEAPSAAETDQYHGTSNPPNEEIKTSDAPSAHHRMEYAPQHPAAENAHAAPRAESRTEMWDRGPAAERNFSYRAEVKDIIDSAHVRGTDLGDRIASRAVVIDAYRIQLAKLVAQGGGSSAEAGQFRQVIAMEWKSLEVSYDAAIASKFFKGFHYNPGHPEEFFTDRHSAMKDLHHLMKDIPVSEKDGTLADVMNREARQMDIDRTEYSALVHKHLEHTPDGVKLKDSMERLSRHLMNNYTLLNRHRFSGFFGHDPSYLGRPEVGAG